MLLEEAEKLWERKTRRADEARVAKAQEDWE